MRLLSPGHFASVFTPLQGKRIGFVRPIGNVGDDLIHWATEQLFAEFEIDWSPVHPPLRPEVDELVFGGGGNMGKFYNCNWDLRTWCLDTGLPVTILPQSFLGEEPRPFARVFVRERHSLQVCPQGVLAPDLALGLDPPPMPSPCEELGVFLRGDCERAMRRRWFSRDPVRLCSTPLEYLRLAARFERIVTDRLHFAISGLMLGRDTTLLPNFYPKNQGMYEAWLADLGCRFATEAPVEPSRGLWGLFRRSGSRSAIA